MEKKKNTVASKSPAFGLRRDMKSTKHLFKFYISDPKVEFFVCFRSDSPVSKRLKRRSIRERETHSRDKNTKISLSLIVDQFFKSVCKQKSQKLTGFTPHM